MWEPLSIGEFEIPWNILLYSLGIILGVTIIFIDIKRYNIPRKEILPVATWGLIFAMIGQKVFNIIFFTDNSVFDNFIGQFFASGSMYYGAEIFGVAAAAAYMRISKLPVLIGLDLAALGIFVAHGVGRIGCYAAGCCHGITTDFFCGVHFPHVDGIVHPTQLYESFALLTIFAVVSSFRKKIKIDGIIYTIYVMSYSVTRFLIELIREDAYPIGPLGISPSQNIAVVMFVFALTLMFFLIRRNKNITVYNPNHGIR